MRYFFLFFLFVSSSLAAQRIVSNGTLFGLDGNDGNSILPIEYSSITKMGDAGKVFRFEKDNLFGILNLYTKENTGLVFDEVAYKAREQYAVTVAGQKKGFVLFEKNTLRADRSSDTCMIVAPQYESVMAVENYLAIKKDSLFGIFPKQASAQFGAIVPFVIPGRVQYSGQMGYYFIDAENFYTKICFSATGSTYSFLKLSDTEFLSTQGIALHHDYRNKRYVAFDFKEGKELYAVPYTCESQIPLRKSKHTVYNGCFSVCEINPDSVVTGKIHAPMTYNCYSIKTGELLYSIKGPADLFIYIMPTPLSNMRRRKISRKVGVKLPRKEESSKVYLVYLSKSMMLNDEYYTGLLGKDGKYTAFNKIHKNLKMESPAAGALNFLDGFGDIDIKWFSE